jgi:tripartite-type tricarboxylate transporter receptor subunit TctC
LDHARKKSTSVALNAIGALPHLAAAELEQKANAKFKYITAKSSTGAVVSLLGRHVETAVGHEPQAFSHGEKMRALCIFEPERSVNLPLVPTAQELGYDVVGYVRDGVAVNQGAPQEVKNILSTAFKKAMDTDEFKYAFLLRRIRMRYLNTDDTLKLWMSAADTYSKIIRDLGIKK